MAENWWRVYAAYNPHYHGPLVSHRYSEYRLHERAELCSYLPL